MMSNSSITTEGPDMAKKLLPPVHPGENLKDVMDAHGLNANRLAVAIGVPNNRILAIVAGQRGISGDTALRLARFFGSTPDFWMNLQSHYEIELARAEAGDEIVRTVKPIAKTAA